MSATKITGRARRQKRIRSGRTLTFTFTWEGGEYIEVAFEGYVSHDVIHTGSMERTGDGFRTKVREYMKALDQDAALAAWDARRVAVSA